MSSWNRVATVPLHRNLFDAIGRSQLRLADVQRQMATGKKAADYAGLGTEVVRNLSGHSMLARQEAHRQVADRLGTSLALMDAHMSGLEDSLLSFRNDLLKAVGGGVTTGLQEAAEEAFQHLRSAMNADEGGIALFAGSRTDIRPFSPGRLSDLVGLPAAAAFANDHVQASARVSDGLDVTYGVVASDIGSEFFAALRTIAEAGPLGEQPTPSQLSALQTAVGQINDGLATLRGHHAENGRRQAQVETLATRSAERALVLRGLIEKHEDADMAEVAGELVQRQTTLEASYSVFSRLSNLSLLNYLR